MREKRVNLVVLTCSVLVATCASVSYCFVTADSLDRYVAVISAIPIFLSGQISPASAATVWIPTSDDADEPDGSVHDEFQEVAHVFARPGVRVVKGKEEDDTMQQAIPWTSLKDEWKIFQKIQQSKRKSPADKLKKKTGQKEPVQSDDEASSEEDDGDEDEEEEERGQHPPPPPPMADEDGDDEGSSEEDDEPGARSSIPNGHLPDIMGKTALSFPPDDEQPPLVKKIKPKSDNLPLAFFGQQNHDDDEKDFQKDEATIFKRKKSNKKKVISDEEDDVSSSNEQAASVEDYADYAADDDDDTENGEDDRKQKNKKNAMSFDEIPLAIREMILNDLANQNNGTGYVPNLTPKVTGGKRGSGAKGNDDVSGENSSEEDDNNAAEVSQGNINDPDPTPPASSKPKKGDDDDDDEEYADGGGKKGKGKKKKGKGKEGGGWGWKPQGWGNVHIAPGWGDDKHHHHEKGWGWGDKHDGVLEQLVRGSTWERVLKYYHWKRDQSVKGEGEHGHHDEHHHHHHDDHHGSVHGAPHDHHKDHGWGWKGEGTGIKKIVKKAFKGSFWERAVHTYAKYKENQAKNPKKPALIDLDSDPLNLGR